MENSISQKFQQNKKTFELLESFLKTGNLPWWSRWEKEVSLDILLNKSAKTNLTQLKEFLHFAIKLSEVRKRIAHQCSFEMIRKITGWINLELSDARAKKELAIIEAIKRAPLENSQSLSNSILLDYLLRLSDNKSKSSSKEWFSTVTSKLSLATSLSKHELITVLKKSIPINHHRDLFGISDQSFDSEKTKKGQRIASNASKGKSLMRLEEEVFEPPPAINEPAQLGRNKKAEWRAFLQGNLIVGVGSQNWIAKRSDQELQQILVSVYDGRGLGEFTKILLQIFAKVKLFTDQPRETFRQIIWAQTLKCAASGLKESALLHFILWELADQAKMPMLELCSTLNEEIRKTVKKTSFGK